MTTATEQKRIEKLTPEQEAQLIPTANKWTEIGLRTGPADMSCSPALIKRAYKAASLPEPLQVYHATSPAAAVFMVNAIAILGGDTLGDKRNATGFQQPEPYRSIQLAAVTHILNQLKGLENPLPLDEDWVKLYENARTATAEGVIEKMNLYTTARADWGYGAHEASWLSFYDFFRTHCGLVEETEPLKPLLELAEVCGWWVPMHGMAIACDRPTKYSFDENKRLHCDNAPAIEFADGFVVWCYHDVLVNRDIIMHPENITSDMILKSDNAEIRRVMMERMGMEKFLATMPNIKVLHKDDWGTLYRGLDDVTFVEVINSTAEPDGTFKKYILTVDPQLRPMIKGDNGTVKLGDPQELTAQNAIASTFGVTGAEYNPAIMT